MGKHAVGQLSSRIRVLQEKNALLSLPLGTGNLFLLVFGKPVKMYVNTYTLNSALGFATF